MIAHYTSTREICTNSSNFGIGKFIGETIEIIEDVPHSLFNFASGLFLVNHPQTLPATHEIRERLHTRLGERMYDFGSNNCEHAVNQIITGNSESDEANSKQTCADTCTAILGDFKEVGIKVAIIIALVSSLAGSLTRYSYVRLMIAGVAARLSNIGSNETCSNYLGNNIRRQSEHVLDQHSDIPYFSEILSSEQIIEEIKASLNNPLICTISEKLAWDAITKTLQLSLSVSISVETIFVITRIVFVYVPLSNIIPQKALIRMIYLRLIAGYVSIPLGVICGSTAQAFLSPPATCFFLITFFTSLFFRYFLTIVASFIYDCFCYKCCECTHSYCLDSNGYETIDEEKSCCFQPCYCCFSCRNQTDKTTDTRND